MASSDGGGYDTDDDRLIKLLKDVDTALEGPKEGSTIEVVRLVLSAGAIDIKKLSDETKLSFIKQAFKSEVGAIRKDREEHAQLQEKYARLQKEYARLHRENCMLATQLARVSEAWKKEIGPLQGRMLEEGPIRTDAFRAEMLALMEDHCRKTIGSFFELARIFLPEIMAPLGG